MKCGMARIIYQKELSIGLGQSVFDVKRMYPLIISAKKAELDEWTRALLLWLLMVILAVFI